MSILLSYPFGIRAPSEKSRGTWINFKPGLISFPSRPVFTRQGCEQSAFRWAGKDSLRCHISIFVLLRLSSTEAFHRLTRLADRLPIPIATSALIQVPCILSLLPPSKSIGILTYDDRRLNTKHLEKLSVPASAFSRIHIRGAPADGHLRGVITGRKPYVHADIRDELTRTAKALVTDNPKIGAIVLECTQMPPFAQAIQEALGNGVVVYDVYTMALWFYSGLRRQSPDAWKA